MPKGVLGPVDFRAFFLLAISCFLLIDIIVSFLYMGQGGNQHRGCSEFGARDMIDKGLEKRYY